MKAVSQQLDQDSLKELLSYDILTGDFTWKKRKDAGLRWNTRWAGKKAGTRGRFAIQISINRTRWMAHQLAWIYMLNRMPEGEIDHINRNPYDNAWINLRDVSHTANRQNSRAWYNSKLGIAGVTWRADIGKWDAHITHNGKDYCLGKFINKEDAIAARKAKEKELNFGQLYS